MHTRAGVPLHPSFAYEIIFQALAFAALVALRKRITTPGELFKLYLAAYAVFRFAVEFVRGNEVVWAGLTRPSCSCWPAYPSYRRFVVARFVRRARTDRAEP
jgi:prolipoprotein diacylglyceryltransferase